MPERDGIADELEALRHELADLQTAVEEADPATSDLDALTKRADWVEARIAELQQDAAVERGQIVDAEVADVAAEEAEDFKPPATDLVVSRSSPDPNQTFIVLDRHDEQQIIEEFQRRALKVMLYDFELAGGTRTVDLSYQGVNEAVRLINNTGKARLKIDHTAFSGRGFEELHITADAGKGDEPFIVITVLAVNEVTGFAEFGTAMEPMNMRLRNGKTKFDIFARTKALNKAQRNALKNHIPEAMRQTLIAMHKNDESTLKVISAGAGAVADAEMPAPLDSPEAADLNRAIREEYDGIRALSVTALLPGQFGHRHRRVQHDLELMRSFHGELVAMREHLAAAAAQESGS